MSAPKNPAPPVLSVVIPNYNDGADLPRAVAAAMTQSRPPDELVIVDDGSTDDSREVIARLVEEIPGVRAILLPENRGVIAALNAGVASARGRYVYMGSANDMVEPGLFAAALEMLAGAAGTGFFASEVRVLDTAGRQTGLRPPAAPSERARCFDPAAARRVLMRLHNFAPSSGVVFDRAALLDEGGLLPEMGSFADGFALICLAMSRGFCFAPIIGGRWVRDPASVSSATVSDPRVALEILARVGARLSRRDEVPQGFLERFERRWRFTFGHAVAGAGRDRLVAFAPLVAPGRAEAAVWVRLAAVPGRAGRLLRLVWLTLRWRPHSLPAIVRTWQRRRLRGPALHSPPVLCPDRHKPALRAGVIGNPGDRHPPGACLAAIQRLLGSRMQIPGPVSQERRTRGRAGDDGACSFPEPTARLRRRSTTRPRRSRRSDRRRWRS